MKRITSTITVMLIAVAALSATVIIPNTANTSFTLMADNSYDRDYTVDRTTWTVKRNGYQIDQMGTNIWTLADSNGTTIVAVNATDSELSDVIYFYYRNKSVNLIAYNTPVSIDTIKSIGQLKSAFIADMDTQVSLYLGTQKTGATFRNISNDTSLTLDKGKVSLSRTAGSGSSYILVTCPECGSRIYVNIEDYL